MPKTLLILSLLSLAACTANVKATELEAGYSVDPISYPK